MENHEIVYDTILNSRVPNDGTNINSIEKVTYYNDLAGKNQTQSFINASDIIVSFVIRKNEEGKYQFAMEYRPIPAINSIMLELPVSSMFRNDGDYDPDVLEHYLLTSMKDDYNITVKDYKCIDQNPTPISQSFTNQKSMIFLVIADDKSQSKNLDWFDVSSLEDLINNHSELCSLQTIYALNTIFQKFKNLEDLKTTTPFTYDKNKIDDKIDTTIHHNIMQHKYRFGVDFVDDSNGLAHEIGLSKNSSQCIMIKNVNGKRYVGLSKQLRSPFITTEDFSEYLYEISAGMLEPGESFEDAAKREAVEETGLDVKDQKLIFIGTQLLSSITQEYSAFYICEMPEEDQFINQQLDAEENISSIEWMPLDSINLSTLHAPLPTKYAILKAKEYYEKNEDFKVKL